MGSTSTPDVTSATLSKGHVATGYTIKAIDEMESHHYGLVKLVAAELGVEFFGMQVLDLPPNFAEYPEHDHVEDEQEEVYVVLVGSGQCEIDGDAIPLQTGHVFRVEAGSRRKLRSGPDGARILAIGCAPAGAYERPADFRLEARS